MTSKNYDPLIRAASLAGIFPIALLFAICGWLSPFLLNNLSPVFAGVPFALLCVLLFARCRVGLAVGALVAWACLAAFYCAGAILFYGADARYHPMGIGGLVGALGVAAAVGIVHRRLLAFRYLVAAAVIGSVAGLAFVPALVWANSHVGVPRDPAEVALGQRAFAVWQGAVGAYIYSVVKQIL